MSVSATVLKAFHLTTSQSTGPAAMCDAGSRDSAGTYPYVCPNKQVTLGKATSYAAETSHQTEESEEVELQAHPVPLDIPTNRHLRAVRLADFWRIPSRLVKDLLQVQMGETPTGAKILTCELHPLTMPTPRLRHSLTLAGVSPESLEAASSLSRSPLLRPLSRTSRPPRDLTSSLWALGCQVLPPRGGNHSWSVVREDSGRNPKSTARKLKASPDVMCDDFHLSPGLKVRVSYSDG